MTKVKKSIIIYGNKYVNAEYSNKIHAIAYGNPLSLIYLALCIAWLHSASETSYQSHPEANGGKLRYGAGREPLGELAPKAGRLPRTYRWIKGGVRAPETNQWDAAGNPTYFPLTAWRWWVEEEGTDGMNYWGTRLEWTTRLNSSFKLQRNQKLTRPRTNNP